MCAITIYWNAHVPQADGPHVYLQFSWSTDTLVNFSHLHRMLVSYLHVLLRRGPKQLEGPSHTQDIHLTASNSGDKIGYAAPR